MFVPWSAQFHVIFCWFQTLSTTFIDFLGSEWLRRKRQVQLWFVAAVVEKKEFGVRVSQPGFGSSQMTMGFFL